MSTWTYTPTDIATSEKDAIRLEVGDTDPQNWLLADQEIVWAISQERNMWSAAARCAEMIAFSLLRRADPKLGRSMQVVYTRAADQYMQRARWLRQKSLGTTPPYFGGVNLSDKIAIATNAGLSQPAMARGMMVNPWTGGYTPDTVQLSPGGQAVQSTGSPSAFA